MPRVRFSEDWEWRPSAGVIVAYRAGSELSVTRACAAAAERAGVAERLGRRKGESDGQGHDDQGH